MRRTASEKMEIIRLVEGTDLPVRVTLRQVGVPRSTFYGWVQRYEEFGFDGLHDKTPAPRPRWNKIPQAVNDDVLDMALARTDLSPRELACSYTDEKRYFVSESSVYRILKSADLITSPAYVLMSASDRFQHPTARVHAANLSAPQTIPKSSSARALTRSPSAFDHPFGYRRLPSCPAKSPTRGRLS